MNKSILILEENSVIHGLVGAALNVDGVTLHHEFNPDNYVDRAKSLMPDLILISNADQASGYAVTRELKGEVPLADVPLILLANSRETLNPAQLKELQVSGVVRKPFEASDLQQQVSRHLNMVDLIGSAFEYKQSQSFEERPDPLADLNVLDGEVLGLLHEAEGGEAAPGEVPDVDFSPVLDEDVLEETLEPESAFEPVEESGGEGGPVHVERMDFEASLEEGETIILGAPESEEEEGLEELGAADLLEDETAEEAELQPSEFDQPLDQEEPAQAGGLEPPLEEIEVEISEEDMELSGLDEEAGPDVLDVTALAEEEEEEEEPPLAAAAADTGEDIPLAVRRMMELKPVLSMEGEEEEAPADEEELLFTAGEEPLPDVGEAVDELEDINLAQPAVFEDEEPPVGEAPPEPAPAAAAGEQEGGEEDFSEELLGDEEIDEERIFQAMQQVDAQIAEEEEEADLEGLEEFESEEKEMDELVALAEAETAAEGVPLEVVGEDEEELLLDQDEEAMMLSALEEEAAFDAAYDEAAVTAAGEPAEREGLAVSAEEEGEAEREEAAVFAVEEEAVEEPEPVEAAEEALAEELDFELEESREPPGAATEAPESRLEPELQQLEAEAVGELEDLEETVAGGQARAEAPAADLGELEEESDLLAEEPLTLEESEDSIRAAALEMGLEEPEETAEPGLGADLDVSLAGEEEELVLEEEEAELPPLDEEFAAPEEEEAELPPLDEELGAPEEEPAPSLVDAMAAQDEGELDEEEATAPARADYPDFATDETGEEMLELGEVGEELELDATGEEQEAVEELAEEDISEYIEDDLSEAEAAELADAGLDEVGDDSEFDAVFAELQAEIAANPEGENLDEVLAREGIRAAVSDLELGEPEEETNLTRAMGISELPGEAGMAEAATTPQESTLEMDVGGAVLDDEIKARLGAVLDEIITLSVRKAVHEEMPKLMEQMMKDDHPA